MPFLPHNPKSLSGKPGRAGFSLVELLVVATLLAVLTALLIPAARRTLERGRQTQCANNLRQLALANLAYASEGGVFVAAAPDIYTGNLRRWHGERKSASQPFDGAAGPRAPYLGADRRIRSCPTAARALAGDGFEAGCGGYGYNAVGLGSQAYPRGALAGAETGQRINRVRDPANTLMFADCAFPQSRAGKTRLIEYSFAEPYRHLADATPEETYVADPSVHFRHPGGANIAWAEGHVTAAPLATTRPAGAFARYRLGWPGGPDNTLFDPD